MNTDYQAIIIYTLAIPLWVILWRVLVGFDWLAKHRLMTIPFVGGCLVYVVNIGLVALSVVPDYSTELNLYSYVEQDAKTVAGLGLAIAVFVLLKFDREMGVMEQNTARHFLVLIFWSFLLAVMGCMPLYWMPPGRGWLTLLRHLKTVPYTMSLFILAAAITLYISEMKRTMAAAKPKAESLPRTTPDASSNDRLTSSLEIARDGAAAEKRMPIRVVGLIRIPMSYSDKHYVNSTSRDILILETFA